MRATKVPRGVVLLYASAFLMAYEQVISFDNLYTERGYCPLYAKEALTRAYKAYHALGGNDVATELYHDIMELPTEPHKEQTEKGGK